MLLLIFFFQQLKKKKVKTLLSSEATQKQTASQTVCQPDSKYGLGICPSSTDYQLYALGRITCFS